MKSMSRVLEMVILVVSLAMGVVFMTGLCEVPANTGASFTLMVLTLICMVAFGKTSYDELR